MLPLVTRLKRQREEDEKKNKQQEETAMIYAEYVKSFEGSQEADYSTFVKSKVYDPGTGQVEEARPERIQYRGVKNIFERPGEESERDVTQDYLSQVKGDVPISSSKPVKERMKEIDSFFEEIRERQNALNEKKKLMKQVVSATTEAERLSLTHKISQIDLIANRNALIDSTSTNLYIGNLSPSTTPDMLRMSFSQFGYITSVKVMFQRPEEHVSAICGFVSFRTRQEAEKAKQCMEGFEILGRPINIRWAKNVNTAESDPGRAGRNRL